jgi:hypothetical protein
MNREVVPAPEAHAMLDALIRANGLQRFAYFRVSGEGRFLPNGIEVTSGHVLDATGRVYRFWTDWDSDRDLASVRVWKLATTNPRWDRNREDQGARAAVGLT